MHKVCGLVQYTYLSGLAFGYTITTSISMVAVLESNCYHKKVYRAACEYLYNPYMIAMGIIEILLSQTPNLHKMSWISAIAAIMSFGHASIGMGLSFAKVVSGQGARTALTGVEAGLDQLTASDKVWTIFRAVGDLVFACTYAEILIEIQDILKSSSPENKVMKKANMIAILTSTTFYMMCGCLGYAAMGDQAPGNMLTGFGFYEPFWLIDLANIFTVVHLLGAYQVLVYGHVLSQPVFSALETWASLVWPDSKFVTIEHSIRIGKSISFRGNLLRLTVYVVVVTVLAMAFPFFKNILALFGAIGYWPMTIYFPVEMYIARKKIQWGSLRWFFLWLLNLACLLVAIAVACGAIEGLNHALKNSKPFKF
ncbi:hypothetical protein SADUNF_Sadunf06G0188100 [Salix dunnii]|uniref:Amino acid transporter transmembrane domain-containing protein n=1 Tax=Salix dunnii TaxID=1413687 RepID=A0A835K2Z4_9ROSI|nr:hypothetical protein SADUNF_Sadunf06G0188100 [Salix dunnii]